jgi:uncharacterized membrane protein
MDYPMIIARVLHIGLGVFWAGAMIFMAIYLTPSMRDAGPDGAKVAAGLAKRRLLDVMPLAALITLISGTYLYQRVSGGWVPEYMRSLPANVIGVGGLAGILAFIVGVTWVRPSMKKAMGLAQSVANAPAEAREGIMAQAGALRTRAASAGKVVAWLLVGATVAMAVARYV